MRKLLSADLFRLWRSRVFWAIACILFFWGASAYGMMCFNLAHEIPVIGWNSYFFNGTLCIGPALAVFTTFFIGTEHSDGGFRNKLIVGCGRLSIYLSKLIVCSLAGILFLSAFWAGALIVGLPGVGPGILTRLSQPVPGILCSCAIAVSYSALFCLIAMLDSSKARSATIGLLLAVFLFAGGFATHDGLTQPEFTNRMIINAAGECEIEENVPNSKYLTGTQRLVYECVYAVLPSCQALRLVMSETSYFPSAPLCTAGWTLLLSLCGIGLFQKKDVK